MARYHLIPKPKVDFQTDVMHWLENLLHILQHRFKFILAGMISILLLFGGLFFWNANQVRIENQAQLGLYEAGLLDGDSKRSALEAVAEKYEGSVAAIEAKLELEIATPSESVEELKPLHALYENQKQGIWKRIIGQVLAVRYQNLSQFAAAANIYLSLYADTKNPNREWDYYQAGHCYVQMGEREKGEEIFKTITGSGTFTDPSVIKRGKAARLWLLLHP